MNRYMLFGKVVEDFEIKTYRLWGGVGVHVHGVHPTIQIKNRGADTIDSFMRAYTSLCVEE